MKKSFLVIIVFFGLLFSFTSHNGQVKTTLPKDIGNEPKAIRDRHPGKSRGLLQDKAGNIWICNGTNAGVSVYDGKTYTNYTEKDGLSSDFVWTILEDNLGKLWFGTADGITCFDGKTFSIIPITTITKDTSYRKTTADPRYGFPQPGENWVMCILQDRSGMYWFGTMSGVYRYDARLNDSTGNGKAFTRFSYNDSVTNKTGVTISSIESILEDSNGNIWFGGRGTKGVFSFDGKNLTHFAPDGENFVSPILQDKSGNIWFTRRASSVYRYDGKNFIRFGENVLYDFCFSMEEDNSGNLWFANNKNGGVTFYDGKSFINYSVKDGLGNNFAKSILKDKEGNIWFSSKDNKLCRYDPATGGFTNFLE